MAMAGDVGRILIVDDHPRNIAILQKIFSHEYRTASATSGEEALRLAPSFVPDLVLLDIMMGGIDGYETCRRLRALPELARTKVIMVSARALADERLAGYEAGADDYVVKPFDADELIAKVRVFLRLRSAEELEHVRGSILTLFNHVTRTPLTTVLGALDLALDDASASDELQRLLRTAREGAVRLNQYVDRLTWLHQLTNGKVDEIRRRESLRELALAAIDGLSHAAAERGVAITVALDRDAETDVDADQVRQAIAAVLENAIHHSPEGGTVTVALEVQGDEARLVVNDQGSGIPVEFLPHIFDGMMVPDIRHHHSGLGLGLATASVIARGHRGVLTAGNAEGGGARFCLALPCTVPAASATGSDVATGRMCA
jgi:two-component system, sensor histidine kinase and response regulator